MGLRKVLQNKDVYFDTNVFIYLLEGIEEFSVPLSDIRALMENNQIRAIGSDLAYAELLPPHAKQGNRQAIENVMDFLDAFNLISPSKEILIHAGILRGETNMKTPDAIHVATAMANPCEIFLTNDKKIKTPKNLEKVILSDYS